MLVHTYLNYKHILDLEHKYLSIIWVEIKLAKNKGLLCMSGYRQWQLMKELNTNDAGSINNQCLRYQNIINSCNNALKENKDMIILMDDNIDTLKNNTKTLDYQYRDLKNIRDNFITEKNITIHNEKPTFFRPNMISCIDHIYRYCTTKISNYN